MLSVVIPAYNEGEAVLPAARRTAEVLRRAGIPYELIFVDDGSGDGTWEAIGQAAREDAAVRGLGFSRNFGKEAAILAGLEAAAGECCAVMDCDLQHPPEKLPEMYRLWREGWEVVSGVKADRGRESGLHRLAAEAFNRIMTVASGTELTRSSDFKLLDRRVMEALVAMPERGTFFRGLSAWAGFRETGVEFSVEERKNGSTHWSIPGLFRYAFSWITAFTAAPLQLITLLGCLLLAAAVVLGILTAVQLLGGRAPGGERGLVLLLLFLSGCLMLGMGLLGYYLGKVLTEVQHRPRYLVARCCGTKEEKG